MLRSAKAKYFENLSSMLRSNPGRFWRRFQCLSRRSRPTNDTQLSVTAEEFNQHFLSIPHKTVANVASTVPACGFLKNFLHNKTVPSIQFSYVDTELVSSLITSLDTHKATGADGISSKIY